MDLVGRYAEKSVAADTVVPPEAMLEKTKTAENVSTRQVFVEALGKTDAISPQTIGPVQEQLGLGGKGEVSKRALETRDIRAVLAEAQGLAGYEMLSVWIMSRAFLLEADVLVQLRNDMARASNERGRSAAEARAEARERALRESIEDIKKAIAEYDEKVKGRLADIKSDSSVLDALQTVAAKRLEEEIREWRKIVSGFEARAERLREERRDEIASAHDGMI